MRTSSEIDGTGDGVGALADLILQNLSFGAAEPDVCGVLEVMMRLIHFMSATSVVFL